MAKLQTPSGLKAASLGAAEDFNSGDGRPWTCEKVDGLPHYSTGSTRK